MTEASTTTTETDRKRKMQEFFALNRAKEAERQAQNLEHCRILRTAISKLKNVYPTQNDIANWAGVSQATISRFLNELDKNWINNSKLAAKIENFSTELEATAEQTISLAQQATSIEMNIQVDIEITSTMRDIAEEVGVDIAELVRTIGMEAVRAELKRRWADENREAVKSQNAYFETHGLPLAKYRTW